MSTSIIYPRKTSMVVLLLASLTFTAGSLYLAGRGASSLWFSSAFFGCCSLVFAASIHPKATFLKIDEECFTLVSFFRAAKHDWREVENFRVVRQQVAFDLSSAEARESVFSTQEALLPMTIGLDPDELARFLNETLKEKKKAQPGGTDKPAISEARHNLGSSSVGK